MAVFQWMKQDRLLKKYVALVTPRKRRRGILDIIGKHKLWNRVAVETEDGDSITKKADTGRQQ
jgi:hypothetical protein